MLTVDPEVTVEAPSLSLPTLLELINYYLPLSPSSSSIVARQLTFSMTTLSTEKMNNK